MASSVDPLMAARVIGDVLDPFVPSISMSVRFNSKSTGVTKGCSISPAVAARPPTLQIAGRVQDLYTLIMTDPDAPSPQEPKLREWIHWIVVDMPGGSDPSQGKEVLPYMGPSPPVGIYRYIFVLFKQEGSLSSMEPPRSRANFNTRSFAARFHLGSPVDALYFNAHKDP